MEWIFIVGLVAAAGYFVINARKQRDRAQFMAMMFAANARNTPRTTPEPDLSFAAMGYKQVALARQAAPGIDLYSLEKAYAQGLRSEGCTAEQALSARWGGAYAIADGPGAYDDALQLFNEAVAEDRGPDFNKGKMLKDAPLSAATLVIAGAHALDPQEYGRFLKFINH